jgi:hypothetical protein
MQLDSEISVEPLVRIAELDVELEPEVGGVDQQEYVRSVIERLREIAKSIGQLGGVEWGRKREIIRLLVHKIEIDQKAVRSFFVSCRRSTTLGSRRSLSPFSERIVQENIVRHYQPY